MIKAGITGGETLAAGELTRILLNHPDILLTQVASDTQAGKAVSAVHRGLVGDTDMRFARCLELGKLDVVFLCGEPWQARQLMESDDFEARTANDAPADDSPVEPEDGRLRIVDLTGAFRRNGMAEAQMVYGLPEWNRKALVRGALRTSLPSAAAMALELALLPLAKNMRLQGLVTANIAVASTEDFQNAPQPVLPPGKHLSMNQREVSTRLDPIAPVENRPDSESASREVQTLLSEVLGAFGGGVKVKVSLSRDASMPRGIVADVVVPTTLPPSDIRKMFDEAYSDHSFAFTIDSPPTALDVANTNKCLIHIAETSEADGVPFQAVRITSAIDNLLKGSAGNAVHCFNLLFGLSERTGLALKASAF